MLDAAFGPVFRYFDLFDQIRYFGVFDHLPKVQDWRLALADRPSVKQAVQTDYPQLLKTFLLVRDTALSAKIRAAEREF